MNVNSETNMTELGPIGMDTRKATIRNAERQAAGSRRKDIWTFGIESRHSGSDFAVTSREITVVLYTREKRYLPARMQDKSKITAPMNIHSSLTDCS